MEPRNLLKSYILMQIGVTESNNAIPQSFVSYDVLVQVQVHVQVEARVIT